MTLPKGRAKKLQPKYIGLYKVVKAHIVASTVRLELPPELVARWVHPTFHMSLNQAHVKGGVHPPSGKLRWELQLNSRGHCMRLNHLVRPNILGL